MGEGQDEGDYFYSSQLTTHFHRFSKIESHPK